MMKHLDTALHITLNPNFQQFLGPEALFFNLLNAAKIPFAENQPRVTEKNAGRRLVLILFLKKQMMLGR